jgi:hypothetical protein
MPNLPPLTIPHDAAAKAEEKAKETDFYAELTDEERAEEGLPPRETAKPEEEKPEAEPDKAPDAEPDEEPEPDSDEATEQLFEQIAGLREDIQSAIGKPTPEATKPEEDPLLKSALEHEDPVIRGLAERLKETQDRLAAHDNEAREARIERQTAKDDADFDAVQASYLIGGQPMTDKQVEQVEDFILQNPDVGRRLTIEQVTRVVFPDATKAPKSPSAKGPGGSPNGNGPPVATIVTGGTSGGAAPGKFVPRANETIESAIQEAGKRFGWKR